MREEIVVIAHGGDSGEEALCLGRVPGKTFESFLPLIFANRLFGLSNGLLGPISLISTLPLESAIGETLETRRSTSELGMVMLHPRAAENRTVDRGEPRGSTMHLTTTSPHPRLSDGGSRPRSDGVESPLKVGGVDIGTSSLNKVPVSRAIREECIAKKRNLVVIIGPARRSPNREIGCQRHQPEGAIAC